MSTPEEQLHHPAPPSQWSCLERAYKNWDRSSIFIIKTAVTITKVPNLQVSTVFLASLSGRGKPYLAANSSAGSRKASGISCRGTLWLLATISGGKHILCTMLKYSNCFNKLSVLQCVLIFQKNNLLNTVQRGMREGRDSGQLGSVLPGIFPVACNSVTFRTSIRTILKKRLKI